MGPLQWALGKFFFDVYIFITHFYLLYYVIAIAMNKTKQWQREEDIHRGYRALRTMHDVSFGL